MTNENNIEQTLKETLKTIGEESWALMIVLALKLNEEEEGELKCYLKN